MPDCCGSVARGAFPRDASPVLPLLCWLLGCTQCVKGKSRLILAAERTRGRLSFDLGESNGELSRLSRRVASRRYHLEKVMAPRWFLMPMRTRNSRPDPDDSRISRSHGSPSEEKDMATEAADPCGCLHVRAYVRTLLSLTAGNGRAAGDG